MKKLAAVLIGIMSLMLISCNKQRIGREKVIKFATCADYPPFEYMNNNNFQGFDIDLARLIAKEMKKEAEFIDVNFSNIFPVLQSQIADAGIATISSSVEREKFFSFSNPYHNGEIAIVYLLSSKSSDTKTGSKIAVQLGTIYEQWVREYMPAAKICLKNTTIHCVEALKAGHVDGVVLDLPQAKIFVKKNRILGFSALDTDRRGFVIAFKKDSYLKKEFDIIITKLKDNGEIKNLINKHINSAYNG